MCHTVLNDTLNLILKSSHLLSYILFHGLPHLPAKQPLRTMVCTLRDSGDNNELIPIFHVATRQTQRSSTPPTHSTLSYNSAQEPAPTTPNVSLNFQDSLSTSPGPSMQNSNASPLQSMGFDFGRSVSSNGSIGAAGPGPGVLPEQKIFPGIVHERAQRGNTLTPLATENEDQVLRKTDEDDR